MLSTAFSSDVVAVRAEGCLICFFCTHRELEAIQAKDAVDGQPLNPEPSQAKKYVLQ